MTSPTEVQRRRLSRNDAAAYLGISARTLGQWAWLQQGPPFTRTAPRGGRCIYEVADLDAWMDARRVSFGEFGAV